MTTVASLVDAAVNRFRDRTAVIDGDRTLTFDDVGTRSTKVANALLGLSDRQGVCVALLMSNRLEYVECDFAVAKAGKVRVAINPRLVQDERLHILRDSQAETLIFDEGFEEFAHHALAEIPTLQHLIKIGLAGAGSIAYSDLLTSASAVPTKLDIDPRSANYIMYTSGTSGRAKGATATNASRIAGSVNMLIDELDIRAGDAMLHVGSLCHGSGSKVLPYFIKGAKNVTAAKFRPETFFDDCRTYGVTGTFVVPTMIGMLLEANPGQPETGLLKSVTYGGAPITPARLTEAYERFGNILVQVYGSCEAPHPVMVLDHDDHERLMTSSGDAAQLTTVGRKGTLVDVRLVNEDGNDVAPGEKGEMWVRGPNLMQGYWNDPDATAGVLDADGWYRTGDVTVLDEDGYYFIVDRARDIVISGGLNVYPAEVEAAIGKHPDVQDVAVIGVPDEKWGEAVKAVVVRRAGSDVDEAAVLEHCSIHLAGYKKPRSIDFVTELPHGSTGKVLKRELRDRYWEGHARSVN
jgi:long-chain acyl-CoA synthetase